MKERRLNGRVLGRTGILRQGHAGTLGSWRSLKVWEAHPHWCHTPSITQGWSLEKWEKALLANAQEWPFPPQNLNLLSPKKDCQGSFWDPVGRITPELREPLCSLVTGGLSCHPALNTVPHPLICSFWTVIYHLSMLSAGAPVPLQTHRLHISILYLGVMTPSMMPLFWPSHTAGQCGGQEPRSWARLSRVRLHTFSL